MTRIINVVRMQLVNRKTFIWLPLIIFGASFAISMIIYFAINMSVTDLDEPMYGGGSQAPLWYFAAIGVQALLTTFPFSQAMSVTRREFYIGTVLTAIGASLALALIYLVGGLIEKGTDGWGINGYFFAVPWIWDQGPAVATLLYFMAPILTFTIGFLAATIYKRFGVLYLVLVGVGVALVAAIAVLGISASSAWPTVGGWIIALTPLRVALGGTVLAAALAGVSYLALRRAIP